MSKMDSIDDHIRQLKLNYDWLKAHMPSSFFKDNPTEAVLTAAHCMMDLAKQENFILSNSAGFSLAIALHEPHLDLKIFKKANYLAIQSYETYLSNENFPSLNKKALFGRFKTCTSIASAKRGSFATKGSSIPNSCALPRANSTRVL